MKQSKTKEMVFIATELSSVRSLALTGSLIIWAVIVVNFGLFVVTVSVVPSV